MDFFILPISNCYKPPREVENPLLSECMYSILQQEMAGAGCKRIEE